MNTLDPTPADRLSRSTRLRHLANWVNLSTALGLGVATAGGAGVRRGPQLLYLAEHYRWRFPTGGAFTVGDVVITRHHLDRLTSRNPTLLEHEERHSRQWMACLGLPFIPLYLLSMGWSWLRTGDRASRCFFERDAGLATGGYVDVPPRPLGPVLVKLARRVVRWGSAPASQT
ncbi:hypothetical protein EXU48_23355 [Occultella glacieicola]|uniref:DUF4157 domain-containing protein n=1 Tax=Occultella glacieicola TaxID=2518684 RepID=A0ABY2DWS0_9MICO|nr:hypothetical protein [Occultella glacieicola]TDE88317.1 hypothetical protein EXU48_23355 [Occultella glacieicola]